MPTSLQVCVAQMTSANRHDSNIETLASAVAFAATEGCQLLALPEAAGLMNRDKVAARRVVVAEAADPYIKACKRLAAQYKIWIHTGSTPIAHEQSHEQGQDEALFLNHANLIDDGGRIHSRYDKIHLFDVYLEGQPPSGESERYAAGTQAVIASTPWGLWGHSICYDLRFAQLYRDYAKAGANVLFIPSAFNVATGAAHWEILLRARAIETGCFVIAAAQVGQHQDGRQTWGHSMVIDPWGTVLLDMGGRDSGFAVVSLDLGKVAKARQQIPSLQNDRHYEVCHVK